MREDLDELAEAFDGHAGPLKLQVVGPWTLAANVWLSRGERVIVDEGACRDLVESLAEGVRLHVAAVRTPRARAQRSCCRWTNRACRPSWPAGCRPSSGFGRLPSLDPQVAAAGLTTVLGAHDGDTVVHCCAAEPAAAAPACRRADRAVARHLAAAPPRVGGRGRRGRGRHPPACGRRAHRRQPHPRPGPRRRPRRGWRRIGLPSGSLLDVVVTPACGLGTASPDVARAVQRAAVETARELEERSAD